MVLISRNYNSKDMEGKRFGKWYVIEEGGRNSHGGIRWLCQCDCGTKREVNGSSLRNGKSASCGCEMKGPITHGMYGTKFYTTWNSIHNRCNNPSQESYKNYGGRGIIVCDRWSDFSNFYDDLYDSYLDHVEKYGASDTTIDRVDVNGNYEPLNVKWSTHSEQALNRRNNRRYVSG